jgi:hypothetical protein
MPGIKVKVNLDRTNRLKQTLTRTEINGALDDTLQEVEDMWIEDVHVITGELQSSIGHRTSGYSGEVFANAEHARFEVDRGGIHDFTTRGFTTGQRSFHQKMQDLLKG